jgi:hypothetical protein
MKDTGPYRAPTLRDEKPNDPMRRVLVVAGALAVLLVVAAIAFAVYDRAAPVEARAPITTPKEEPCPPMPCGGLLVSGVRIGGVCRAPDCREPKPREPKRGDPNAIIPPVASALPAPSALPADFGQIDRAATVEIHDSWNGLGPTHDWVVRLKRHGNGFAWRAKLAGWAGSLGDSVPDPYTPNEGMKPCACAVDAACACEHARDVKHAEGTITAAPVESFLRTVASHVIDAGPPPTGMHWTDDYPKGHVIVWMTSASEPIHLSFLDQQKQWRANGRALSPDPASDAGGGLQTQHSVINASFNTLLESLGEKSWQNQFRSRGRL